MPKNQEKECCECKSYHPMYQGGYNDDGCNCPCHNHQCQAGCCSYDKKGKLVGMCGLNKCNHSHCLNQPQEEKKCACKGNGGFILHSENHCCRGNNHECDAKSISQEKQDWEERFDKEFLPGDFVQGEISNKDIKQFIKTLLSQQKEERENYELVYQSAKRETKDQIIREIEGMKENNIRDLLDLSYVGIHNVVIELIIQKIKEL